MSEYSFSHAGQRVRVDRRGQTLLAELQAEAVFGAFPFDDWDDEQCEHFDPDEGLEFEEAPKIASESQIYPTVAAAGVHTSFTPQFALAMKAKANDDKLYAAIDKLVHHQSGRGMGLFPLVSAIRDVLPQQASTRFMLDAALHLGCPPAEASLSKPMEMRRWLMRFNKDAKRSKPIGFYAEDPDLAAIFRHDRALQWPLKPAEAEEIRSALLAKPTLRQAYIDHLELVQRLTGPFALPSVLDEPASGQQAVLPPSDSIESRLIKSIFPGGAPVPEDFKLGDELCARIKDGRLQTEPRPEDGWHAHQFHANAALLHAAMPGLKLGPKYKELLEDNFKALFVLNRETHAKQLDIAAAGCPPLIIKPQISVEPLPEHYSRTAAGYRFLRQHLHRALGTSTMCELVPEPLDCSLEELLIDLELLFRGAAVVAREELGQPNSLDSEDTIARSHFRRWQRRSPKDPDLATDLRVAVPVFFDEGRQKLRISATLGVEPRALKLSFVDRPKVEILDAHPQYEDSRELLFEDSTATVLVTSSIECNVSAPPTRAQLRAICDEHKTPAAIKAALERADFS